MKKYIPVLILLVASFDGFSQVPTVKFSGNTLYGNLPYGRHFKVRGSRVLPFNQKADVIQLELSKKDDVENLYEGIWWYPEGAVNPVDSFEFYIPHHLRFNRKYVLKFNFYVNKTPDKEEAEEILKEVLNELVEENQELMSFSLSEVSTKLKTKLETKFPSDEYVFGDGNKLSPTLKFESITDNTKIFVGEYVISYSTLRENEQLLGESLKARKAKKKALESENDNAKKKVIEDEIKTLDLSIGNFENAINDQKSEIKKLIEGDASKEFNELIESLISRITQIAALKSESSPAPDSKADFEAIRLGTVYGGGLAYDIRNNDVYDGFSYIGLKYFLKPVDKRIANPYISGKKRRLAILVGFLVGNDGALNYRGQDLEDIGGIKPIIGLSYDLNRYLAFDFGGVFFEQPSLSPLDNSSDPKASFFFGLSLDADAFNRFKALFNSQPYTLSK